MAVPNGPAPPHPPNEQRVNEDWSEQQCKVALAHLEKLQDQLDELRTVIPQIVRSLAVPHTSPTTLHGGFKQAAWGGSRSIDVFKTAWNKEETQTLFAKARKSMADNSDLTSANGAMDNVPKYGWIEALKQENEGKREIKVEDDSDVEKALTTDETRKLVEDYRNKHPGFQLSWDDDCKKIDISFKTPTTRLRFIITKVPDDGGLSKYKAECQGMHKLFQAITRCLALRPKQQNVKHLLDMIAAYADTKKPECHKCNKIVDSKGMTVAARRAQPSKKNGGKDTEWAALHESCL